jgi:uncharacterized protein YndB with AHSA1/START domain
VSADHTLVITRLFDAPRDLVFAAWVDAEQAGKWWGPRGFIPVSYTMDVRVGGAWRRVMRSPDGVEYRARGVYREIAAPERLAFTYAWEHNPDHSGHETLVTITFAQRGDKTELTLRQALFETVTARDAHGTGWSSCLDRFADYLVGKIE